MNISLYISELLRDYDEVCLSDIGTFYKERTPASFNEASGVFNAPFDRVRFRPKADGDDVLVNYISEVKKISVASSRYFINKFTNSIQQSLTSDNQVELQPIGVLKKGPSGLQLIGNHESPAYFGLQAIQDPSYSSRVRPMNVAVVNEAVNTGIENESSGSASGGKIATIVLIVLLITAGILYIFNPSLFNLSADKPITERNKAKVDSPAAKTTSEPAVVQTAKDSAAPSISAVAQDTVKKIAPAVSSESPVLAPSFEVIGASFALPSEADTYVNLMKSRGIKAKVIEDKRKPKYKISLGSFTTYEAANVEKRRVQSTFNKEAWILTLNDKAKK
ncbi:sporulation related protein [Arcticibacter pallidicorallinus]|uniref:Sporulation related protein n=1 Tax=Arcticibacter pallidicorallinus TaxID=1259464 RepID=A0A2T0U305_9SPHI|nr:SPOR domain-containing protein [Arcticibacter pallidicorallinus]PRY52301.1 sporulation related protein [Arcticibacter pallidicorallinus]